MVVLLTDCRRLVTTCQTSWLTNWQICQQLWSKLKTSHDERNWDRTTTMKIIWMKVCVFLRLLCIMFRHFVLFAYSFARYGRACWRFKKAVRCWVLKVVWMPMDLSSTFSAYIFYLTFIAYCLNVIFAWVIMDSKMCTWQERKRMYPYIQSAYGCETRVSWLL